jgi:hypothetical protein
MLGVDAIESLSGEGHFSFPSVIQIVRQPFLGGFTQEDLSNGAIIPLSA